MTMEKHIKYQAYGYDLWGNQKDGFEVNNVLPLNQGPPGFSVEVYAEFESFEELDDNEKIFKALKEAGVLTRQARFASYEFREEEHEKCAKIWRTIYVEKNMVPVVELRLCEERGWEFEDLPDSVKEKAIEKQWEINVDYDWWAASEDRHESFLKAIGVDHSIESKYYFDIDRGSYLSFVGTLDFVDFHKAIEDWDSGPWSWGDKVERMVKGWWAELQQFKGRKGMKGLLNGSIECEAEASHGNDSLRVTSEYRMDGSSEKEETVGDMAELLEKVLRDAADHLLSNLRDNYERRTSEDAIKDTLVANESCFDLNGNII